MAEEFEDKQGKCQQAKSLKAMLTLATTALLGGVTNEAEATESKLLEDWQFDSAFLYYSEADRVTAAELIISGTKVFENDEVLNLKATIDTLSGASANGAVAQPDIQTFTRPSGQGQYSIQANTTPLDDTFKDTRVQLNAQWTQPIAQDYTYSIGGHLSKEFDYLSLGFNNSLAIDFNKKNTTLALGFSYFYDVWSPIGGLPKPLASMLIGDSDDPQWDEEFAKTRMGSSDSKTTADFLLGFTQIINRRMLVQFNYSLSHVDGYLTDPFKIVSQVNTEGVVQDYRYEHRPNKRVKQTVYGQTKYHFDSAIVDFSYRYLWDDWQITSHTVDTRLYIPIAENTYIQPRFRFYQQGAADFYQPYLMQQDLLPEYVSADYRIGEMTATTLGIKLGIKLSHANTNTGYANELAFRLEYYQQTPTNPGFNQPGVLATQNIFPKVEAILAQVSYSF